MVVTALWHTGPVMVYFGQEVGEPGAGNEGFSGEDGRTTIFDYWGVPEHQKWVNKLQYDGGKLSEEQRQIRDFYQKLLNIAHKEAIAQGHFYDLYHHNRMYSPGFDESIYPFLRFTDDERLLVVTNFDPEHTYEFTLKIPQTAIEAMNMTEEAYQLQDIFQSDTSLVLDTQEVIVNEGAEGIPMTLAPLQSCVFQILSQN